MVELGPSEFTLSSLNWDIRGGAGKNADDACDNGDGVERDDHHVVPMMMLRNGDVDDDGDDGDVVRKKPLLGKFWPPVFFCRKKTSLDQ